MKIIKREYYLNKLASVVLTHSIKVITGARRSGKSKIMEVFADYLTSNDKKANIIFVKLQLPQNKHLKKQESLYAYITSKWIKNKNNYVLIDEIQDCEGFEELVTGIYEEEKYDIYITGSNAFLLSSDLATLFTGRTFQVHVMPFSFAEMIKYYEYERRDYEDAFDQYVMFGGFSGCYQYKTAKDKYNYIANEVYAPIIQLDVLERNKVNKKTALKSISDFLIGNIGNTTNSLPITNYLNSKKVDISNKITSKYIGYLTETYLFSRINRYDVIGKKYLSTDNKYYLCDHAIKYAMHGTKDLDYGRVNENIVYWELIRRGYEVYIGKYKNIEIDFICQSQKERLYVQVSLDIDTDKTLARELKPLLAIKDNYKKIIITRSRQPEKEIDGIKIYSIINWLLNEGI